MLPSHDAQQPSSVVKRHLRCRWVSSSKISTGDDSRSRLITIARHHLMHLSESVDSRGLGIAHSAQRLTILDHALQRPCALAWESVKGPHQPSCEGYTRPAVS
jgi:hypothetical protein